jgi:hypothetical protein
MSNVNYPTDNAAALLDSSCPEDLGEADVHLLEII